MNIGNVEAGCYCGDPNTTGTVDISDLIFIIAYLFNNGTAPNPLSAGDIDGSGEIDITDVTYLVAYLFQGGASPVCSWLPQM